jgi:adenylosuccinate lyase
MASVIGELGADRERLLYNLQGGTAAAGQGIPGGVLAEPAYILLAETGVTDAHEVIRKITLIAEREGISFAAALEREPETLSRIGGKLAELGLVPRAEEALSFFEHPEKYNGLSVQKAKTIAAKYRELMRSEKGKVRSEK